MKKFNLNTLSLAISMGLLSSGVLANEIENITDFGVVPYTEQKLFDKSLLNYNSENVPIWRIPALLRTQKGSLIIAADKRWQHRGDWGDIDTAIRTSQDEGKTWSNITTVIDLVSKNERSPAASSNYNPWGAKSSCGNDHCNSAFVIDAQLTEDKINGRLFMMIDMFPESTGFFTSGREMGSGYINIGGKDYLRLHKDGKAWTVRENGEVYNEQNQKTEYRVVISGDPKLGFRDLGDVYDDKNNKLGNVYLQKTGSNANVPFTAPRTSYLWMTTSDDDGKTWSSPKDITPQVKKDWMGFIGTGPGVGIQLKNGNLVLPIYYTNRSDKQSTSVIISRDGGENWELAKSPNDFRPEINGTSEVLSRDKVWSGLYTELTEAQLVELNNGDLKMFMRNKNGRVMMATSKDGGYTWIDTVKIPELKHGYSQLSIIKYSKLIDGKEYLIFSGQSAEGAGGDELRRDGKVYLGEVQNDGTILWQPTTLVREIDSQGKAGNNKPNGYVYSSMAELGNGNIGLAYENTTDYTTIMYLPIDLQELFSKANKVFSDKRREAPLVFSYSGPNNIEKIGDGVAIKQGIGNSTGNATILEGVLTLNQQPDSEGHKNAFLAVNVENKGTLRLGSADQMNFSNITLNGTLDLNGNHITLAKDGENTPETGLRATTIPGSIINDNVSTPATLTYRLANERSISGNLGNQNGTLNLDYQPVAENSNFTLNGNSVLNVLNVTSGAIHYAAETVHRANELRLASNTSLHLNSGTNATIGQGNLAENSQVGVNTDANKTTQLTLNSTGAGTLQKTGDGLLKLSGHLAHTGTTQLSQGQLAFEGQLAGPLNLSANTTFGGNANITGEAIWQNGSKIEPGLAQGDENFGARVLQFANVINHGAEMLLRVNNNDSNISAWAHDQVLIAGDLTGDKATSVDVQFLGTQQGQSDTNRNGRYDPDEGISLIQVLGNATVSQFTLGKKFDQQKQTTDLYQYELVSIDKSVSASRENKFGIDGARFYDYRLQNLLVDENGQNPEPVVRQVFGNPLDNLTNDDKPILSDAEVAQMAVAELNAKELARQQAEADKQKAEDSAKQSAENAEKAKAEKQIAEKLAYQAITDAIRANKEAASAKEAARKAKAEADEAKAEKWQALTDKYSAEALARQANADKQAAEQLADNAQRAKLAAEEKAAQAHADKQAAQQLAAQAMAEKLLAETKAKNAEQAKEKAEAMAQQAGIDQQLIAKLLQQAELDKEAAELLAKQAEANRQAAETLALKAEADKKAAEALADKANADRQTAAAIAEKALADKEIAEALAQQAVKAKDRAENAEKQALLEKQKAEMTAEKAKTAQENAEKAAQAAMEKEVQARRYRVAINKKVPAYLVANNAIFYQGENVRRQFMDNLWAEDKKGFYVSQQNGNSQYRSNLAFADYGYGYKATQSSTLFGGFTPISANTELHLGLGLSKQTVTPYAVDGASETRYKTTSLLVGLHHQWDQFIVNNSLAYHLHKGRVSTPEQRNVAQINAKQWQIGSEVGYQIPVAQFSITPIAGVSYHAIRTAVNDSVDQWQVTAKPYHVLSSYAGVNVGWKNERVRLSTGVMYENNHSKAEEVTVAVGRNQAHFTTGDLGNALVWKLNGEVALTERLALGLRLEHRQALSEAKRKQTQFGGKLEYKF